MSDSLGSAIIEPPWSKPIPLFSGVSLLFVDTLIRWNLGETSLKWLILVPIALGLTFKGGFFDKKFNVHVKNVSVFQYQNMVQTRKILSFIYTILFGSLVIAGVIRAVESEEKSYGTLLSVPLLALCSMKLPPPVQSNPRNMMMVMMVLINLACVVMSITWTTAGTNHKPTTSPSSGLVFLFTTLMIPSTPIADISLYSDPLYNLSNTILAITWYAGIFISISSTTTGITYLSYGGIPLLLVSSISSLLDLFPEKTCFKWKITWCMITLFVGTFLSWETWYTVWIQMGIVWVLGISRIVTRVYPIEWRIIGVNPIPSSKSPLPSMFSSVRIDIICPQNNKFY